MKRVYTTGRGIISPVTRMEIEDEHVLIRIDDKENPAFWVETRFPLSVLRKLIEAADATGDSEASE